MKYANVVYERKNKGSVNLGDDLQLIAVDYIYKKMNIKEEEIIYIPFSQLSTYDGEYVILPISFPFYGYTYDLYITMFSEKIIPVFLGLSIMGSTIERKEIDYLKRFQPIGCRDPYTMRQLRKNGIMAYTFGCLTLSFTKDYFSPIKEKTDKNIYIVDLNDRYLKHIPNEIKNNAVYKSQLLEDCDNPKLSAINMIREYIEKASLVITTRLHCALPCIALGIPVVIMKDKYSFRFPTLSKYIHIYEENEFTQIKWGGAT